VTDADAARILTNVRRLTKVIVLCCALGGCARAAAPPSVVPPVVLQPAASTAAQSVASAEPSAIAIPAALPRTPERFGGISTSERTSVVPSRPRLKVEKAIEVTTMSVVRDDTSESSVPAAKCEVQILHENPAGKTREVATLNVDGAPAQHEDVLSLLKRKACEAGANAVVIKSRAKTRVEGVKMDHVEAVALVVGTPKPPVDPSPAPQDNHGHA
jgi:hypothetical protein